MGLLAAIPQRVTTASGSEHVVSLFTQHKLATLLVALVVASGLIAIFAYSRSRKSNATFDSIAVLPFETLSSDQDSEYLSYGLTESLIYRLSQLPSLKVSPTSTVFSFKGKKADAISVGKELGVSAVLSGRIMQRGDNLTISAELIDVDDNRLLWGEQYDRKMSDLLVTQREIAKEIVENLKLKVSGDDRALSTRYTENQEAYQLYLRGRFQWNKRTNEGVTKRLTITTRRLKRIRLSRSLTPVWLMLTSCP